jgi:hypothetical protein
VSADLVEDERQGKGKVLTLDPGVAGEYCLVTQVRGGLLDDGAVGPELLMVRHCFPGSVLGARGKRARPA